MANVNKGTINDEHQVGGELVASPVYLDDFR